MSGADLYPCAFYIFAEKEILLESDVHNDRMMLLDLLILMVSFFFFLGKLDQISGKSKPEFTKPAKL